MVDDVISEHVAQIKGMIESLDAQQPSTSAAVCAEYYRTVRDIHDMIDELKKQAYHVMNNYAMKVMPMVFENEGVSTITLSSGYRVTISQRLNASIIADKKPDAYVWLMENDLGDLITESVNASSLSATARSLIEEGRQLPDDLFKTVVLPQVSLTRTK